MKLVRKDVLYVLIVLLALSPLFGVVLADMVGYHEPLDLAAEKLRLSELEFNWTPLQDYGVPGIDPIVGYIISGLIGIVIIYAVGFILLKLKSKGEEQS